MEERYIRGLMENGSTTKSARSQKSAKATKTNGAAPTATAKKTPAKPVRTLFGTDGIRGVANEWPITPELALSLGKAVAHVAGKRVPKGHVAHVPRVLIGKD